MNSPLSAAEQTALHSWVANGGALIVTSDYGATPYYDSFTATYGVTQYKDAFADSPPALPVGSHPVIAGVSSIFFAAPSSFSYNSANAKLVAEQYFKAFGVVLDPSTNFNVGGCVLVWGNSTMFIDAYIVKNDNVQLADMVSWAHARGALPNGARAHDVFLSIASHELRTP